MTHQAASNGYVLTPFLTEHISQGYLKVSAVVTRNLLFYYKYCYYDLVLMRLIIELAIKMAREGMRDEDIADFIEGSPITISN